jgi:hypothetical protein
MSPLNGSAHVGADARPTLITGGAGFVGATSPTAC